MHEIDWTAILTFLRWLVFQCFPNDWKSPVLLSLFLSCCQPIIVHSPKKVKKILTRTMPWPFLRALRDPTIEASIKMSWHFLFMGIWLIPPTLPDMQIPWKRRLRMSPFPIQVFQNIYHEKGVSVINFIVYNHPKKAIAKKVWINSVIQLK